MRKFQYGLVAAAIVLIAIPLAAVLAAWAVWDFSLAVAGATAWLASWLIIFTLVPGVIFGALALKGLPWMNEKVAILLGRVQSLADRGNLVAERAGRKAVTPNLWLYARAAWLRGFLNALRREFGPGGS